MALSLNQAQSIVQKLSNDQLMKAYTDGSVPQFIVFSEMQRRQQMANSQAKMPTETVAEKMVGKEPEAEGIAGLQQAVKQPPMQMYEGGPTEDSTLTFGYSEDLPPEARKIITARLKEMKRLEKPDYNPPQYAATGDLIVAPPPVSRKEFGGNGSVSPQYIYNSLVRDYGYSPQAAAAITGNVMHESYGDPRMVQKNADNPGRGLVQWDKDRYNNMLAFSKARGIDPYSADAQIAFIDHELKGSEAGSGRKLSSAQNLQEAQNAFLGYLRPKFYSANNPSRTIAYNDRYNKSADVLGVGSLPPESKPEGADLRDERAFGYDPAFGGGRDATSQSYQYDRRSPLLDPSKMQSESSIDKGLAALRAASVVQQMGRPPMQKAGGGAVYLEGSSDGVPVSGDYVPSDYESYNQDQAKEPESGGMSVWQERERAIKAIKDRMPQMSVSPELSAPVKKPEEETSSIAGRAFKDFSGGISQWLQGTPESNELSALLEERQKYETGLFEQLTEKQREERARKIKEIDSQIDTIKTRKNINFEDPSVVSSMQGVASLPRPSGMMPEVLTQKPEERGGPAQQGIPSVVPPSAKPPSGAGAGGAGAGAGTKIGGQEDTSFKSVMKDVQDAIGSKIPDELKDQMKEHQKTLASMRNDKIVDTLFAAAKTLAGQRKGSVNFADAVANAGLAAKEAQDRIYKAEDDMRKYRADFMKAQDDGNYKAANIAMGRINNEETNRRNLQTAMMQMNRMIKSQEASETKANIAAASKEVVLNESKLADFNRMLADPSKIGVMDQKSIEAERRRLQAEIASSRANLIYWQTGASPDEIMAELKKRGLI